MTVRELCETSGRVTLLNLNVVDREGVVTEIYRIGKRARHQPEDTLSPVRVTVLAQPIHVQDLGARYDQFGFVSGNIPQEILNAKVVHWTCRRENAYREKVYIIHSMELTADVTMPEEQETENEGEK